MKIPLQLRSFLCAGLIALSSATLLAASLELSLRHTFSGSPLQLDAVQYRDAAAEKFSITRVSYLLDGFALEHLDGSWLELGDMVGWLDAQSGRNSVLLTNVPAAKYRGVRFHIGLNPAVNHAATTNHAPDHPLNPNLNGLHWSWQGGYIFLAVEGRWQTNGGPLDGWSFHLARDTNRVRIHLATELNVTGDMQVEADFDLAALLNAPRPISRARDGSSTHSRDGDPVAAALVANLPGAFSVRRASPRMAVASRSPAPAPRDMPATFTPYRFTMSATFPLPDLPKDNPLIKERVALGWQLFHDGLLSRDGSISCASCHVAAAAFTDPRRYSVGVSNRVGTRNGMPLFNLAWKQSFFWDGRAPTLRAQTLMPIQDHAEMDETLPNLVTKLRSAGYAAGFARSFASADITPERIGLALEQFLLTITSFDSKFDRAVRGEGTLNAEEQRGLELFMTEHDPRRGQFGADCFHCHGGPLFQSQSFANNGLDEPTKLFDVRAKVSSAAAPQDPGRAAVTGRTADRGKFATPSLRNVALTAPYMHDGRFATLEAAVEHYSSGVRRSTTLDPNLAKHPEGGLHLSAADQRALVAFLRTLTDESFQNSIETQTGDGTRR